MIVKKHNARGGKIILAVCDSDIIGKRFFEGDLQLDLSSDFYKGEELDEKRICELFRVAYIINVVGEKSVKLAIKEGIVDKKNIIKIKGIPHAQIVME